jgi:iron complex outermembrane receptor protein
MKETFNRKYLAGAVAAAYLALDTSIAFAQLEEVIVTARKREESLQDVPVVVQAFSAEALAASRPRNQVRFRPLNASPP